MAKWYGVIGYADTVEVEPGIWEEQVIERPYYGELVRNTRRLQTTDKVNDDLTISNQISIVSDPYAINNFHAMKYAVLWGTKWKITSVEAQYPRLILEVGGVYNGN